MRNLLIKIAQLPIRGYQIMISPWMGSNCRFHPTCSAYALEALETHGVIRGTWLSLCRVAKCNPWVKCKCIDPVPPPKAEK